MYKNLKLLLILLISFPILVLSSQSSETSDDLEGLRKLAEEEYKKSRLSLLQHQKWVDGLDPKRKALLRLLRDTSFALRVMNDPCREENAPKIWVEHRVAKWYKEPENKDIVDAEVPFIEISVPDEEIDRIKREYDGLLLFRDIRKDMPRDLILGCGRNRCGNKHERDIFRLYHLSDFLKTKQPTRNNSNNIKWGMLDTKIHDHKSAVTFDIDPIVNPDICGNAFNKRHLSILPSNHFSTITFEGFWIDYNSMSESGKLKFQDAVSEYFRILAPGGKICWAIDESPSSIPKGDVLGILMQRGFKVVNADGGSKHGFLTKK